MPTPVQFPVKELRRETVQPKKGGGRLGKALGGAAGLGAGLALAPSTGGLSLAAAGSIGGLMGGGMALGGMAGEMISPSKAGVPGAVGEEQKQGVQIEETTPIQRRTELMQSNPLLQVESAIKELPKMSPEFQKEALPPLLAGYSILRKKQGVA